MTELLVSVRSADEARAAVRGGADLIDVKEPSGGSLGAASPEVCREVLRAVAERVPVSMACGELLAIFADRQSGLDAQQPDVSPSGPVPSGPVPSGPVPSGPVPSGMKFAKLGLAGVAGLADWPSRWTAWLSNLPRGTAAVAVLYADWREAAAPSPVEVLRIAEHAACEALLIDTHDKRLGDLFALGTESELREVCRAARARGLRVVLAGSLRGAAIDRALALRPDVIAVRGAVCAPDRQGALQADKVARLAARLAALPRCDKTPTSEAPAAIKQAKVDNFPRFA